MAPPGLIPGDQRRAGHQGQAQTVRDHEAMRDNQTDRRGPQTFPISFATQLAVFDLRWRKDWRKGHPATLVSVWLYFTEPGRGVTPNHNNKQSFCLEICSC